MYRKVRVWNHGSPKSSAHWAQWESEWRSWIWELFFSMPWFSHVFPNVLGYPSLPLKPFSLSMKIAPERQFSTCTDSTYWMKTFTFREIFVGCRALDILGAGWCSLIIHDNRLFGCLHTCVILQNPKNHVRIKRVPCEKNHLKPTPDQQRPAHPSQHSQLCSFIPASSGHLVPICKINYLTLASPLAGRERRCWVQVNQIRLCHFLCGISYSLAGAQTWAILHPLMM